ncbi:flagellar biosynthesis protein FlhF [Idiomarina seosinensis]|uniref:Flagellar biosynthesis protein FlhF n=1 Tax=Idiomarina seosinensis TaxID=281739 RepID=A0A432ZGD0_9GAMM|nr:flagellar biosynthesis protein FlhF [Idiomarina seosinensis]RUO77057.1 flagellar biosynthesis protein FlhF [Idiomarina seosinensis]
MKIKRFFAEDMRRALLQVKEALGPDAVIMSNKKVNGGIEIVAAVDPDAQQPEPAPTPEPATAQQEPAPASSLAELLQRQNPRVEDTSYGSQPTASEASRQTAVPEAQTAVPEAQTAVPEAQTAVPEAQTAAPQEHTAHAQHEMAHAQHDQIPEHVSGGSAEEIADLKAQIRGIKDLLQHQLSGLMKQEIEREEPIRAMLTKRLMGMGLSERIADQIACFIPEGGDDDDSWEQCLQLLEGQLNTTADDILTRGGAVALVGPTGVGKTTTIAKLAARYAQRHGADKVALVTTDTFRIGASEQLQTYGRIIGCPVKVANNAKELADALLTLRDKSLILIDTAGMGQRDKRLSDQLATLLHNSRLRIRPYLVLSATSQTQVLNDAVKQFKTLPLSGCIFTKLDECLSLGESISVAVEQGMAVSYLTNGQQVPEDIKVADAHYLVSEAERLYDKSICSTLSEMPKSYGHTSIN